MTDHPDVLTSFRATVAAAPDAPLVHYFDTTLTRRQIDEMSDAFAAGLQAYGVARGDRIAACMQNVPEFPVAVLGIWKAGGIVVSVNPMYRDSEVEMILTDSGARTLLTADDVSTLVEKNPGQRVADPHLLATDIAFLTYTSGTTGPPKGAMNTHANVVAGGQTYRDVVGISADDVIGGFAPLFHVTGITGHLAVSLITGAPLVLGRRFEAATVLELIERHHITFVIAAVTALTALVNEPTRSSRDLSSMRALYSGGQAVSAGAAAAIGHALGCTVHIAYGMTETTAPTHMVPFGRRAPIDAETGTLSVGVCTPGHVSCAVDEDDRPLPPGEVGEIVVAGPQVVPGYWDKPEETAAAFRNGWLHTGDVGYVDADGWFFVVDRQKDLINASGFKVWPREVEDVLYLHPAVRDAAVVGVPDEYRGETVHAFVSLYAGANTASEELIAFARQRLAAYKYPRVVTILPELPKTVTGKILRRELRG